MCSDGVSRTGTFLTIHCQLERLKTEGVVDFLQAIKSAHLQRPGIVSNTVSQKSLDLVSLISTYSLRITMCSVMKWSAHIWTTLTLMLTLNLRKLFSSSTSVFVHIVVVLLQYLWCMLYV